ncbi:lipoyltransferase 1, mitochondrial [Microplitis mediator]|uniref:lipoyltransferase 1, mitochondrial n=1 Tax=Microplitis mediator TaxID=375433 RepID=UPI002553718C|nr:lipoyltransferase 1, mitochondrial [Microplitis mediator]
MIFNKMFARYCRRAFTQRNYSSSKISEIKKSVFISQSTDIFKNLALEDWLYRYYDLENHHVLLLWKSDPCVVIGRHQNPWMEANVKVLEDKGIYLARRNSGGGTVYHDNGNLNLSFLTPRSRYSRKYNLEIITRALYRNWGIESFINKREDIIIEGDYKISGTAAKLGRPNAYHHCTLLIDVDKNNLSGALEKKELGIVTNATESIKSPVKNLKEINRKVNWDEMVNAVGWEFLRTDAMRVKDGGSALVSKQKGFQMINPTEDWFPGLDKLTSEFSSWEWIYGKTPSFTVNRLLKFPRSDVTESDLLNLTLQVEKGIIEDIKMSLPSDITNETSNREASVISNLRGTRYHHKVIEKIIAALGCIAIAPAHAQKIDNIALQ